MFACSSARTCSPMPWVWVIARWAGSTMWPNFNGLPMMAGRWGGNLQPSQQAVTAASRCCMPNAKALKSQSPQESLHKTPTQALGFGFLREQHNDGAAGWREGKQPLRHSQPRWGAFATGLAGRINTNAILQVDEILAGLPPHCKPYLTIAFATSFRLASASRIALRSPTGTIATSLPRPSYRSRPPCL